ncbi:hypothetical protein, partial [Kitasatospora sp. NPDC059827]|uniref:hypothetical protein n=1 Tax=Kitasatospora sp. NPDC059827 TaxID=3346964 RepID=UPI0036559D3D
HGVTSDGQVALAEVRGAIGACAGPAAPGPAVHAEVREPGAPPHTFLARHPRRADQVQDDGEDDDQDRGPLGDIPHQVRRRAAGTTQETIRRDPHRAR